MKKVVTEVIQRAESNKNEDQQKAFFFKGWIVRLGTDVYDRSCIPPSILQNIAPDFYVPESRERSVDSVTRDPALYNEVVKTAKLVLLLGVKAKKSFAGVNGAQFLRDLSGRNIGVFKEECQKSKRQGVVRSFLKSISYWLISSQTPQFYQYRADIRDGGGMKNFVRYNGSNHLSL